MKEIPVIILGIGGVGQALVQQIVESRGLLASRAQTHFYVVALADSSSWIWDPAGIDDEKLLAAISAKRRHESLSPTPKPDPAAMLDQASAAGMERAIVVDVTATDGMEPMIDHALQLGYGVAMANKKALAGDWAAAQRYFNHRRVRHESTVGGGQPVIATLRYLLDVNDPIFQIEGQLSGTLGFICGALDKGMALSQAIAEAKAKGFTEPDPREDLGGKDVMRKVLILGRMAGWPLEAAEISVESLYTPELASLTIDEFMTAAPSLDAEMKRRVAAAAADGNVLRYVAEVGPDGGKVGLKPLPAGSPLANLKYISFRTGRYYDEPLMIGGKGAGVEMTAAGVLGDMIGLVREQNQ